MPLPDPLPDELAELIAQRFRVLAEPTRIKLLNRLRRGEATVHELTETTVSTQQNVSKHLAVLHQAGILSRRKAGNHAYYSIADPGVFALCEDVCGSLQQRVESLRQIVDPVRPRPAD
jgi:DNA-binding transcriptional ArsR family regulator